jgi:multimeric flavodoxin WrbA
MKRILIVDGGPRRNMNTAALCEAFAEGANETSSEIQVQRTRLYDLPPFRGCVSCLACKLRGRENGICAVRDSLHDTLHAVNEADGFALASPIYFSEWTAVTRAFLERLVFPWLHYTDFSCDASKKMPVAFIYSMNAPEAMMSDIRKHLAIFEGALARALGDSEPVFVEAHTTIQTNDYSRYAMEGLDPAARLAWHDAHWNDDLAIARTAGRRMAEKALVNA